MKPEYVYVIRTIINGETCYWNNRSGYANFSKKPAFFSKAGAHGASCFLRRSRAWKDTPFEIVRYTLTDEVVTEYVNKV